MSSHPVLPVLPPTLLFEGGKKKSSQKASKKQLEHAQQVNSTLSKAGINREILREKWGVTLWRAFFRDGRAVLTVNAEQKKVDMKGLTQWLNKRLKQVGVRRVSVLEKNINKCCKKACKSCLHGNPAAKKDWSV